MSLWNSIRNVATGKALADKVFKPNTTIGRMLSYSSPLNAKKNWSEYVFGGGLPVQAGLRAMKLNKEDQANAEEAGLKAKAHSDEVNSLGAGAEEVLRNKRRRGLYATILTGSGPTMGTPAASSGAKTLGG